MAYINIRNLSQSIAIAAGLLAATPALAAGETSQNVQVDLSGIDLASPAGQAQADRRIVGAARQACGVSSGMVPLSERTRQKACTDQAIDHARARLAAMGPQRGGTLLVAAEQVAAKPGHR